jgi:tetratricopeptide (TPR) repeat protein
MKSRIFGFVLILFVLCIFAILPVLSDPTDAAGWFATGQNLTATENYSGAFYAYNQSLTLDPTNASAWNGIADVLNRENYYTANPLSTLNMALDASNQSLALNGSSATAWINQGQILYNIGSYYQRELNDKAAADLYYNRQLDAFNKAISVEPDNAEAWFNKAYALCGMDRCTEGLAAFQHVETLDPNYPNLQSNIDLAQQVAATETPFYVKYAVEIIMAVIACIAAALWYMAVRKKY